jgi:hypothetical protein
MMRITKATKIKIIGLHESGLGVRRIKQHLMNRNITQSLCGITNVIKNWINDETIERKKGS